jgi:hypothetical protein
MSKQRGNTVTTNKWYWAYLVNVERLADYACWYKGRKLEAAKDLKEYIKLMAGFDADTTKRQARALSKAMKTIEDKWRFKEHA